MLYIATPYAKYSYTIFRVYQEGGHIVLEAYGYRSCDMCQGSIAKLIQLLMYNPLQYLHEAGWTANSHVVGVTQPRRVAVTTVQYPIINRKHK